MDIGSSVPPRRSSLPPNCDQIALVLQGGGALGAYQAGVYEGLHEAGLEPGWVAGVSIGSINAAIIAGNPPETAARASARVLGDDHSPFDLALDAGWRRAAQGAQRLVGVAHHEIRPAGLLQASYPQSLVQAAAARRPRPATTTARRCGKPCCGSWISSG